MAQTQTIYIGYDSDTQDSGYRQLRYFRGIDPYSQNYKFIFREYPFDDNIEDRDWYIFVKDSASVVTRFKGTASNTDTSVTFYIYNRNTYDNIQMWSFDQADGLWGCMIRPVKVVYNEIVYSQ